MHYKIIGLFVCFLITGCSTLNNEPQTNIQTYGSGLVRLEVSKFDKKESLFNQNSKYYISKYGYDVANSKQTIDVITALPNSPKSIRVYSPLYGSIFYCDYKKDDPNLKVFNIFLTWASQASKARESTKQRTNELISNFKCDQSSVPKNVPDWYVEIEKTTQQPILVSNANQKLLLKVLTNRTIALTEDDVIFLLKNFNTYFKE